MKRTWIFGSANGLTSEQKEKVKITLDKFLPSWNAHGNPLTAGYEIIANHFIRVWVDESIAGASGCSIDALTHTIQDLEQQLGIKLMDRMQIFYKINGQIHTLPLYSFKQQVKKMDANSTVIYQMSVSTEAEFKSSFCVPLKQSWAAKHL